MEINLDNAEVCKFKDLELGDVFIIKGRISNIAILQLMLPMFIIRLYGVKIILLILMSIRSIRHHRVSMDYIMEINWHKRPTLL